ncbi:MAG: recombinase zinc beta ribbon domain-containing protein [bacterium]
MQGLLQCGWCGSLMSTKYCTSRGKLHPYYQCTKNSHGGKTACDMRYVPAAEIEKAVLKKLSSMAQDKKLFDKIIKEANDSVDSNVGHLKSEKISQENKLRAVKASIDNIINAMSKGIGKTKSISIKLNELEAQREGLERDIDTLGFEIDKIRQQVFNAQLIHQALVKFSQVYDKAEPMDLKELLPNFVQRIIWKPTEIEIALYDQPIQKGQFPSSNHSGTNALEFVDWLPG